MRENESSITRRNLCAAIGGTVLLFGLEGCGTERKTTATEIATQMKKWDTYIQDLQRIHPKYFSVDDEDYILNNHTGKRIKYRKTQEELVSLEYSEDKSGVFSEYTIRFSKQPDAWKIDISYSPKDVSSSEWYFRSYTTNQNPIPEKKFEALVQQTNTFIKTFAPSN